MPEFLQARPDVLGDLGPDSSVRIVNQLSPAIGAAVRKPSVSISAPRDSGRSPWARGVDQVSRATWDGSDAPRCRTGVRGDLGPGRGPAGSTNTPGQFAIGCECPQCGPTLLGDSASCPMARVVDQLSWMTHAQLRGPGVWSRCPGLLWPVSEGPWCRPGLSGDSVQGPMAREVDQISRATHAQVLWPAGLPGTRGQLGPVSEGPRC